MKKNNNNFNQLDVQIVPNLLFTSTIAPQVFDLNEFIFFETGKHFDKTAFTICS
jgi:hypothetical protein